MMYRTLLNLKVRVLFRLWSKAQDVADWAAEKGTEAQADLVIEYSDVQAEFDQLTAA